MAKLQAASALLSIFLGKIILFLWLFAANDKTMVLSQCGGCIQAFHDLLYQSSGDLVSDYMQNMDAYPLLICFGVVLGLSMLVTGFLGFANDKAYAIMASINITVFVVLCPVLYYRVRDELPCIKYAELKSLSLKDTSGNTLSLQEAAWRDIGCRQGDYWEEKHKYDSYDFIWSTFVIGSIFQAYQIATSVAHMVGKYQEKQRQIRKEASIPQPNSSHTPLKEREKSSDINRPEEETKHQEEDKMKDRKEYISQLSTFIKPEGQPNKDNNTPREAPYEEKEEEKAASLQVHLEPEPSSFFSAYPGISDNSPIPHLDWKGIAFTRPYNP